MFSPHESLLASINMDLPSFSHQYFSKGEDSMPSGLAGVHDYPDWCSAVAFHMGVRGNICIMTLYDFGGIKHHKTIIFNQYTVYRSLIAIAANVPPCPTMSHHIATGMAKIGMWIISTYVHILGLDANRYFYIFVPNGQAMLKATVVSWKNENPPLPEHLHTNEFSKQFSLDSFLVHWQECGMCRKFFACRGFANFTSKNSPSIKNGLE